jgi:hypothetical protein
MFLAMYYIIITTVSNEVWIEVMCGCVGVWGPETHGLLIFFSVYSKNVQGTLSSVIYLGTLLTSWTRDLIGKLTVAHKFKKLLSFTEM